MGDVKIFRTHQQDLETQTSDLQSFDPPARY